MSDDEISKTKGSAGKLEKSFCNSFITKLREKERDLEQYLLNNDPKTRELEKEIVNLRKLLNNNFASLNIDLPRQYKSVVNEADVSNSAISNDSDSETIQIIETNKNSVAPQKKILLKPSKFQSEPKEEAKKEALAFNFSTPLVNSKGDCHVKFHQLLEQNEIASTVKEEILESVRQHFSLEAEKEILDSFFQQEDIQEDLNNSVKKGFDFFAFVRDCREKLEIFLTKQENNETNKIQ